MNISFAMKYKAKHNCEGVFKERYHSKMIDEIDLKLVLESLEKCTFVKTEWLDIIEPQVNPNQWCLDCDKKAKEWLDVVLSDLDITYDELIGNKKLRNELIKIIRQDSTLSLSEIGKLFGGLSESAVCKILSR
jgi:hypothetical protein